MWLVLSKALLKVVLVVKSKKRMWFFVGGTREGRRMYSVFGWVFVLGLVMLLCANDSGSLDMVVLAKHHLHS